MLKLQFYSIALILMFGLVGLAITEESDEREPPEETVGVYDYESLINSGPSKPMDPETSRVLSIQQYVMTAEFLMRTGRYSKALEQFEKALVLDPDNLHLAMGRLRALMELHDTSTAETVVDDILESSPTLSEAHFVKGRLFEANGKMEEAIDAYKRGLESEPKNLDLLRGWANLAFRSGRFNEAIEANERITQIEGNDPRSYFILGTLYHQQAQILNDELDSEKLSEEQREALEKAAQD